MPNTSYDTLTIQINADSKQANRSINALSKNLQNLNDVAKNLDIERINEAKGLLLDIASIDFSNVSKGLQDVVNAFKAFNSVRFMKATQGGVNLTPANQKYINANGSPLMRENLDFDFQINEFDKYLDSIKKVYDQQEEWKEQIDEVRGKIINFNSTLYDTRQAVENILFPMEQLGTNLSNLGINGRQWEEIFNSINYQTNKFSPEQIALVRQELLAFGKTAEETEEILSRLTMDLNNMPANNLDNVAIAMQNLGLNSKQVASILNSIKYEVNSFDTKQIESIRGALLQLGYTLEEIDNILQRLGVNVSQTGKKSKNFLKATIYQFQKILKYRIIRKIIQDIYKAFTEGIEHIASFDKATKDAYDKIKANWSYISDSIGSVLAPIIQLLEPILSAIADVVGEVASIIGEVFATLNGQTQFAKAKKDVDAYNKSLEKTQSIGIDELNVLSPENQGSFEYVDIEQIENVNGLKDTISSILGLVKEIANVVLPVIRAVLQPIMKIVARIFAIVNEVIQLIMVLLEPLIEVINMVLGIITETLNDVLGLIGAILDNFVMPIVKALVNTIIPVLRVVFAIVSSILYVLEAIIKTVYHLFSFQWHKIGSDWDIAGKVSASWSKIGANSYASGGFPEDGFFFANHNELVGTFDNGKTAVANNEQITEGIYRAVKEAMLETRGSGTTIEIDGYDVAKVVTKRQNNMDSFIKGGNLNYAK